MQEPLRLENPAAIAQLLTRALETRAGIALRIQGSDMVYSSMLLDADYAGGMLLLDELLPQQGNDLVRAGTELRIQARVDGGHIEFQSKLIEPLLHEGSPAYRASLPSLLLHHERRFAYRLSIPSDLPLTSTVFDREGVAQRAKLVDISRLGAGTVIFGQLEASIGSTIPCVFDLPDLRLSTEAQVRSIHGVNGQKRLGLLFSELGPGKRQTVERAVTSIERTLLRMYVRARS